MFSEAEMHIVDIEELTEVHLPPRQLDLGEDGVGVDVGQPPHLPIVIRTFKHAGDVDEQVCGADNCRTFRIRKAEPLRLPGKPVRPLVGQPETCHKPSQVLDIKLAAFADSSFVGIIGPLPRVFQVVDIMAEARQAKDVLKVIPCHSS